MKILAGFLRLAAVLLVGSLVVMGYLVHWAFTRTKHETYPEVWRD